MVRYYCDRCKKQIKIGDYDFPMRFQTLKDEPPAIGSYRGEVSEVKESPYKSDRNDYDNYVYRSKNLCVNCQKELDLMVNEYMGVKKRK